MRVAVCGFGNRIRGDDGIGSRVAEELQQEIDDRNVLVLDCEASPENILGKLQEFGPDKLILIDAVEMGKKPGEVGLIDIDSVRKQAMSTHKLPISMFIDYLQARMKFKLHFIGVQPGKTGLDQEMSEEVRSSMRLVKDLVKDLF